MQRMNQSSLLLLSLALGALMAVPSVGVSKAKQANVPETDGVCVDSATVDRVTSCPEGIDMGKRRKKATAQVGTTTARKEQPKKKVEEGPGLDRAITKGIIEGSFRTKPREE